MELNCIGTDCDWNESFIGAPGSCRGTDGALGGGGGGCWPSLALVAAGGSGVTWVAVEGPPVFVGPVDESTGGGAVDDAPPESGLLPGKLDILKFSFSGKVPIVQENTGKT